MTFLRKSVKRFTVFIIVICFCLLTACGTSDDIQNTQSSKINEDTTISQTTPQDTSINTETTTPQPEPEPHVVSWLDPADPELYNFTPEQKKVYMVMMEGFKNNIKTIAMPCKISSDEVEKIYTFVKNNLYEYCNLTGKYQCISNSTGIISISVDYKYDGLETENKKEKLSQKADQILSQFYNGMTDWDKIKYIHDYIVLNCTYDLEAANSSSAYGALIEGKAACEGYSKAMAYLCNKAGIEAMLITGYAGGDAHMWNMVKYNDNWYHIDVTWDDPINKVLETEHIKYKYFNVTTSQIRLDHKIIPDNNFMEYPEAIANEGNYFIKKGAYINTYDEARKIMVKQIASSVDKNIKHISVRAATQTLYNDIVNNIANPSDLSSVLREANNISDNYFDVTQCALSVDEYAYIIDIYIKEISQN